MTVSRESPYRVSCTTCGETCPTPGASSPGNARRAAKQRGWDTVPGVRDVTDQCPGCLASKET